MTGCSNCGEPIAAHRCGHLIPHCPGKCRPTCHLMADYGLPYPCPESMPGAPPRNWCTGCQIAEGVLDPDLLDLAVLGGKAIRAYGDFDAALRAVEAIVTDRPQPGEPR